MNKYKRKPVVIICGRELKVCNIHDGDYTLSDSSWFNRPVFSV